MELLLLLLILTACSDASPTAPPDTSTTGAAIQTTQLTPAIPAPATSNIAPTTEIAATPVAPVSSTAIPATTAAPVSSPIIANTAVIATTGETTLPPTTAPTTTASAAATAWKALGGANCCQNFSFGGDGRLVYYDQPPGETRLGSWAFDLKSGQRTFLNSGLANYSADLSLAAISSRQDGNTRLQNVPDGTPLGTLANSGSRTVFAPDKKQVAYLLRTTQQDGPEAPQRFSLVVSTLDGRAPRSVWTGRETANLSWLADSQHLLLTGRDAANSRFGLWVIGLDGSANLIVESKGLTVATLSGDGQWVAYIITLQGAERSGVWLAHIDGSAALKQSWLGGFRWDSGHNLYYLPVRQPGETASSLWKLDPVSGKAVRLTDPARFPLQIALDQWEFSPGGTAMAFRNGVDNALWLLTF